MYIIAVSTTKGKNERFVSTRFSCHYDILDSWREPFILIGTCVPQLWRFGFVVSISPPASLRNPSQVLSSSSSLSQSLFWVSFMTSPATRRESLIVLYGTPKQCFALELLRQSSKPYMLETRTQRIVVETIFLIFFKTSTTAYL